MQEEKNKHKIHTDKLADRTAVVARRYYSLCCPAWQLVSMHCICGWTLWHNRY